MARGIQRVLLTALCIIFSFVSQTNQVSSPESSTYVAAVVEYSPTTFPRPDNMMINVKAYEQFVKDAAKQDADIIVFPELGLAGYGERLESMFALVPEPDGKTVPCDGIFQTTEVLGNLSCIAKENNMYLVVNLPEQYPCTQSDPGCPSYNRFQYNTNVVFDRTGAVIARYRKFNLFGEDGMNITATAELSTFDTDFGVTFGTFICFDLMFHDPAVSLVKDLNITDIVFSTAWFSELPFLTAVQAQSSWASAMDVNFLGSGYNDPKVGSGGSGIYMGSRGPLVYIMPEEVTSQLLVATVYKKGRITQFVPQELSAVPKPQSFFLKSDVLEVYTSEVLSVERGHGPFQKELCHHDLCCNFLIQYDNNTVVSHYYRAAVFDGVRSFDGFATGGLQVCGLLWCKNEDEVLSCSQRSTQYDYTFTQIMIYGDFKTYNASQMPNTLAADLLPMPGTAFTYLSLPRGALTNIILTLNLPVTEVSTFAIYGRDFSRDGEEATKSSTALTQQLSFHLVLVCLYLALK